MSIETPSDEQGGKVRLFTAVSLPTEVKASLETLMHKLKTASVFTGAHPGWVRIESVHQTLVFLGWQQESRIEAVKRAMDRTAPELPPFQLGISGLGLFPNPKNPRVISVDLTGDIEQLAALQKNLSLACEAEGFEREDRDFRPHITLARIKSMRGLAGLRDVVRSHSGYSSGLFQVDRVTLYQSILKRDGAEYHVLYEAPLGGAMK